MTGNQLDVIIDKKPIRALVDSGASFSVISDKYRRFLKKVLFADAKSVMLKVADGNFVRPIGKCVLRVRINNRELPFEFIVLSHCSHDVILDGLLEASQAVIDCGQNELVLEDICRDSQRLTPGILTNRETSYPNYPKFSGLFTKTDKSTAAKTNVKHRIFTGDHAPINQRAYRVSPTERRIIHEEVQKMLDEGIVQPSESPWSSPVVLVRKKDGSWRFCVDYRKLNSVTKKDVYPLPRIDDTLDCLKGAKFFSSMDLRSGYWQIEIDEADREKTAFITPEGLYEFKVMPFGLCNAPATFERMMDNLLRNFKWTMCLCYLDDIIVFSETLKTILYD
ncbi:hypothetical protein TNCV_4493861 [Trichonephila clavipes]|nr:hypothetical protein TNCV_4493861 [Trichonephila clavipes]